MATIRSILCCCGSGIGSSILVEMNLRKALTKLGRADVSSGHASLSEIADRDADLIVTGEEMLDQVRAFPRVIALKRMISEAELTEKLEAAFRENREKFLIQ